MSKRKTRHDASSEGPSRKKEGGGWDESASFGKGSNPFAALRSELDSSQPAQASGASPGQTTGQTTGQAPALLPAAPKRASIHVQRKGRGGKTVTVLSNLGYTRAEVLEAWCADWRQQLGCGGQVDGEEIILQGDQRARVSALLERLGVTRIAGG